MAHFQMEQELNLALRLDTTLNIAPRKHGRALGPSGASGSGSSLSTSQLLAAAANVAGGNTNLSLSGGRSRSASRLLSPSRFLAAPNSATGPGGNSAKDSVSLNTSRSPSRSRLTLRTGTVGSEGKSRSRSSSRGRSGTVGDRFIPNRSTCDMDAAHHSIVNSNTYNGKPNLENNQNGSNVNQR